jgi:hypothetical protein
MITRETAVGRVHLYFHEWGLSHLCALLKKSSGLPLLVAFFAWSLSPRTTHRHVLLD